MALARPVGTLTLHYCADVVVEDLHQLLCPSVHVHGCAELLSHRRESCIKGQAVGGSSQGRRGGHTGEQRALR